MPGPLNFIFMASSADAMFVMNMGTVSGDTLLGPFV